MGQVLALSDDSAISARHLFVYSVLFDDNVVEHIPPSVYAVDVSRNGTYLAQKGANKSINSNMAKSGTISLLLTFDSEQRMVPKGPVLLIHGDFLRISPHGFAVLLLSAAKTFWSNRASRHAESGSRSIISFDSVPNIISETRLTYK